MFSPARLAVGLEPLSVPGFTCRKPHPFRYEGTDLSVSPLITLKCVIWLTNYIKFKHPPAQSKERVSVKTCEIILVGKWN